MLMDINTLATIQQDRQQELMRQAAQQRLVQTHTAKGNRLQAKVTTGVTQSATRTSLQEKLFTVFQMRIRTMLPR
jgi:hypothetical protein